MARDHEKDRAELRRRAMERLAKRGPTHHNPGAEDELRHELDVRQAQLEVQNEELRRAQAELMEAHDRYLNLYEFAPVGYLTLDASATVREINLAGIALLQRERSRVIGLRAEGLFAREDRDSLYLHLRGVAAGREPAAIEMRLDRPDGRLIWVLLQVSRRGGPGATIEFRVTMSDITRRKRAEEALERARTELEQRVEERTTALSGTVQALEEEMARRSAAEASLRERSEQLRTLASELALAEQRERQRIAIVLHDGLQQYLAAARFRLAALRRSGEPAARQTGHDVSELLSDAIEAARSLTAELSPPILHEGGLNAGLEWLARWMEMKHGLTVKLEVAQPADKVRQDVAIVVFESVRELLFNVVKHAQVQTARVCVERRNSALEVTVADQGAGFDPRGVRARGGSAGGIGLFRVSERLDQLGGALEIDSAPGRGTRLVLTFPLGPSEADFPATVTQTPAREPTGPRPSLPAGEKIRVVLVDDHTVMRQGLATLLREEPDMVVVGEASDGESAIRVVREVRPDVVLMDISMPGMNGIEATRSIHAEQPSARVIGLSMYQEAESGAAIREAGAIDYLSKSGPAKDLLAAIRNAARPGRSPV